MNAKRLERCIVGIAGGSGSGKTTFARRIVEGCAKIGIRGQIFSLDSYYAPLNHLSFKERQVYNFDHPDAIDLGLIVAHLEKLRAGQAIKQPVYDFKIHTRKKKTILRRPTPLIIVEGLYALHFSELLAFYDYKLFVSTGIATAILRRIERDINERGRDVEGAKHQILSTVLPMYEDYVKPTQKNAHFSINWDGEEIPDKATEGIISMLRDFFSRACSRRFGI
ncbi:MAG: uridine kinase [Elusimicrobia bacterium]|nr:uridine kinase [Elusimicrobiota bacterium]